MSRIKLLLVLLVFAISTAIFSYRLSEHDGQPIDRTYKDHKPDYYMENSSTLTMNLDGSPKNKLYADYLAHYPNDDTTELLKPKLELFNIDKPPTVITAEKGWITSNNEVILLSGTVQLKRLDINGDLDLQVDTSDVKILVNEDYAETEKHAVITDKRGRVETVGMRAFMNQKRIELLNNVKGRINPKN